MKIKNLIFFACIFQLGSLAAYGKPLLVVLLMVKNENQVIIPTLETYLSSTVTTDDVGYILYDTGSTDGTDTLAEDFFKDNGISQFKIVKEHYDTKTFPFGKAELALLKSPVKHILNQHSFSFLMQNGIFMDLINCSSFVVMNEQIMMQVHQHPSLL